MESKKIISDSIKIKGIGNPNTKTVFDLLEIPTITEESSEEEKQDAEKKKMENLLTVQSPFYKSLETLCGRKLVIEYKYVFAEQEIPQSILVSIPFNLKEEAVKAFILQEIEKR